MHAAPTANRQSRSGLAGLGAFLRRYWLILQREHIPWLVGMAAAVLLAGAVGVFVAERTGDGPSITSFGEALWYGIVTMTTVGYGDFTPRTGLGRLVGVLLMLAGMSLLSVITATVASILVAQKIKEGRGLEAIKMKNHVLICGWNQYAERVLDGLIASPHGQLVLVNELPEEAAGEIVARYEEARVQYVRGDPAAETTLERAGVRDARAAIVLADASRGFAGASDERTTLITLALKSLKPDLNVTVEALDLKNEAHLRRAGADDIVISGEFNGFLLSSAASAPGISQVVRSLLSLGGTELRREPIPPEFVGRSFGEMARALRARDGFLAVAVVTEQTGLTLDDLLTDNYSLVDLFIKQQFSEAGREYLRFEEGGTRVLVNPSDLYVIGPNDTAIGIPRQP